MNFLKFLVLELAVLLGVPLFAQEARGPIRLNYRGREVHFPEDARQFKGWRHFGHNTPLWQVSAELPKDVFTFARLRYPYRRGAVDGGLSGGGSEFFLSAAPAYLS